ncbi:hypothetical protein BT67DRAFT_488738 [Trichocladium antarcticum]|uniref:Thioesterase domain-containing protein n=1 Tax=Trichocladium antarcticum TaxID=1450529 RepID=A0AAN6US53_9PEZI|nr:hypothetical protein BT67DRAFT_488738 [Trichocladium antarcticum]
MVVRIQYRHLVRVAQRQGAATHPRARCFQTGSPARIAQHRQHQPFSTCPARHQDQKPAPVPETPPAPASAPAPPTTASPTPSPKPAPPKKRTIPRLIFATAFLLLGIAAGSGVRLFLAPPSPVEPDSEADAYTTQVLHAQAAQLPLVAQLAADPAWDAWDAYASLPAAHRAQHTTAGALRGARGLGGYQRVFRHRATGEVVSVVFFGPATAGWPGVVHGGCLATVLDESCGRAAFQQWGGRAGLTARLGLEYKRVTLANGFYAVRVRVRPDAELPEEERGKGHYKCFVDGVVEDVVTGDALVTAEALFVALGGKNGNGGQMTAEQMEAHSKF